MRVVRCLIAAVPAASVLGTVPGYAANAAFQDYFFDVCGAPTNGALATRCGETPAGLGNLSGDSESSMNPSQGLSRNQSPVAGAQSRSRDARERDAARRDAEEDEGAKVDAGPFSLLAHVTGSDFERKVENDLERGYEGDARGLELGFDYRSSTGVVLGVLAGATRSDYDFVAENSGVNFNPQANAGGADLDSVYLTGFAAFSLGDSGFIDLAVGYESTSQELRRNPIFQESTRTLTQVNGTLTADADGDTFWSGVNGGVDFGSGAFSAGLYAGATYTKAKLDPYTENDPTNSGLAMHFAATDRESLLGHAGVRMAYAFSTAGGVIVPQLRVEYQHEFEDGADSAVTSFVLDPDASTFQLGGAVRDSSSLEAGFGISAAFANGWQPFFNVDVLTGNDDFDRTRIVLGVRVEL